MAPNMVHPGKYSMWTWHECVFYYCWKKYSINVRSNWFMLLFSATIFFLMFCLLDLSITERWALKSPTIIFIYFFFLQFYQFLPYVFWCLVVRCFCLMDCYILLENLPLYHHAMGFFISKNFTYSEVCFV